MVACSFSFCICRTLKIYAYHISYDILHELMKHMYKKLRSYNWFLIYIIIHYIPIHTENIQYMIPAQFLRLNVACSKPESHITTFKAWKSRHHFYSSEFLQVLRYSFGGGDSSADRLEKSGALITLKILLP